jgi:hypothetical protein
MKIDEDLIGESDEDPAVGFNPLPDWWIRYLDCLIREVLLIDKMEADGSHVVLSPSSSSRENFTRRVAPRSYKAAPYRTREAVAEGYPRGDLWTPHRAKVSCPKCVSTGLLLANHYGQHREDHTHLRRVPVLRPTNPFASPSAPDDPRYVAVRGPGA